LLEAVKARVGIGREALVASARIAKDTPVRLPSNRQCDDTA